MAQEKSFLVRLNEDADLTKQVAITLPRIGFEIQNLHMIQQEN